MKAYPLTAADRARLERDYTCHAPDPEQPSRMQMIRDKCAELAEMILSHTPRTREQSLALTHVEQASMFANAAITRGESVYEQRLRQAHKEDAQRPTRPASNA